MTHPGLYFVFIYPLVEGKKYMCAQIIMARHFCPFDKQIKLFFTLNHVRSHQAYDVEKNVFLVSMRYTPVLRIDNQQNFKIMKISILFKSFISLFYIIRYIL